MRQHVVGILTAIILYASDDSLEHGVYRVSVLLVQCDELLPWVLAVEGQSTRKKVDAVVISRNGVCLAIVLELQMVLDDAKERVTIAQYAIVLGCKKTLSMEFSQAFDSVLRSDFGMLSSVRKLKELNNEFDISNRPAALLDVAPEATFL